MDVLADILTVTRLTGHVGCHTWAPTPWAIKFDAAPRVWCHVVAAGTAKLAIGSRTHVLGPHDLVLLPHGTGHVLSDGSNRRAAVSLDEWRARPSKRLASGAGTELMCGSYTVAFAEIHPVLRLLPQLIHIPGATLRSHAGLQATLDLLLRELSERDVGFERAVSRLLEVLFVLALRHWLDVNSDRTTGWLGALRDEPIGRALVELHMAPAHEWTVASLAKKVGLSRAVFARRFTAKVGETPLGYLRKLRIDLATVMLQDTDRPLAAIAESVGYTSEFAFNRAFQRARGVPPGRYRRARAA